MTKQAFLVFHRDYPDFLTRLGQLGVLHVIERVNPDRAASMADMNSRIERIEHARTILEGARAGVILTSEEVNGLTSLNLDTDAMLDLIERTRERKEKIVAAIDETKSMIEKQEPWGEYSEKDFLNLEQAGYQVYLFRSPLAKFETAWEKKYFIFEIGRNATCCWFMLVAPSGSKVDTDAERVMPARLSLMELHDQLRLREQELSDIIRSLAVMKAAFGEKLAKERRRLDSDLALTSVYLDTIRESDDTLRILEGWVPKEHAAKVKALAEETGALVVETAPAEGEMPPVKLHNTLFSGLFEPISKLFDLPNYMELDLTPYFAPFFMIFFGFCLGDAGYGIVFILLGALFKLRLKKGHRLRPLLTLGQYFGLATIVFGLLSGTFFGMNLVDSGYTLTANSFVRLERSDIPAKMVTRLQPLDGEYFRSRSDFLRAVKEKLGEIPSPQRREVLRSAEAGIPLVRAFRHVMQDPLSMFYLSLLIGAIQIVFGIFVRVLNIIHRKGYRYALSPVGWLILILALALYTAGLFNDGATIWLFYILSGISGLFIFLLNKPDTGIFNRIGTGIWDSYNMVTGFFGDLLSYIRLFALGISSAILGFVFNDISLQLLNIPWIGWLFFLLILLTGHTLNILLATLGAFVHPMRLTFVEFYKNAGFEGGGKEYKPFRLG